MTPASRIAHLTFYKCGSQWVRDVLTAPEIVAFSRIPLGESGINLLAADWPDHKNGSFMGPVYNASFQDWAAHRTAQDRALIVLRDPRDQIISTLFSWTYSHAGDIYADLARKPMLALSLPDRLQFCITQFSIIQKAFGSWAGRRNSPQEYITSYEKLLADESGEFQRIFDFLGWVVPPETAAAVLQRLSFRERSGRNRGETDIYSHYRRGIAGDWQNYFTRELGRKFETIYPGLLVKLGYEADCAWHQRLPAELPGIEPAPDDGAADSHSLNAELTRYKENQAELERVIKSTGAVAETRLVLLNLADQAIRQYTAEQSLLRQELAKREADLLEKDAALTALHVTAQTRLEHLLAKQAALDDNAIQLAKHEAVGREIKRLDVELVRLHQELLKRETALLEKESALIAVHAAAQERLDGLLAKQAALDELSAENTLLRNVCREREALIIQQDKNLQLLQKISTDLQSTLTGKTG